MIRKKNLKGKYITYKDKDGKFRTEKVIKVYPSHVTVRHIIKIKKVWRLPKTRVKKDRVIGRQFRKSGLEKIKW